MDPATQFPQTLHPIERFLKLAKKIQENLPLISHVCTLTKISEKKFIS